MANFVKVAGDGEVALGTVKCVRVGDRTIALFNENGTLQAYDDYCTHVGGPVSRGSYENGIVTCPWHGAQFRVEDGKALTPRRAGICVATPCGSRRARSRSRSTTEVEPRGRRPAYFDR